MPRYADTLDYLAKNGPREFYEGEIARSVVDACMDRGGHLDLLDFKQYRVIMRSPLSFSYRSYTIHTNPPPNAGGPLIAFLLKLLETVNIVPADYGTARHLNWLTSGFRKTAEVRAEHIDQLLSQNHLDAVLSGGELLLSLQATMHRELSKSGNTTHVSVVDQDFNIASVTTSVGEGCGFIIPGTDIMLNNMLGEEDLNTSGFHRWRPDVRISSMMAPTVVSQGGRPVMGLGSGGSNRIRSAIAQAIVHYIDFGLDFDDVVNNARIHWERGHLDIEPGFEEHAINHTELPSDQQRFLWSEKNMYFGGVHAVFIDEKGNMHGAGDRRRAGSVSVA
jgi:gamma-glutamyltranspeptidase/glutathione hydrolase